jgi:hypothetical protein
MLRSIIAFVLLFTVTNSFATTHLPLRQEKILTVVVDSHGYNLMGRDTLTNDKLESEIKERLWKSYLGTGKMYDRIDLQMRGDVAPSVKTAAIEAIKKGQDKALAEYCVLKHKNSFDKLSAKDQEKIRQHYPVLFQQFN